MICPAPRPLDDAVCWRVNVEAAAASARRLHYCKLPSGQMELSRFVVHDDMAPGNAPNWGGGGHDVIKLSTSN